MGIEIDVDGEQLRELVFDDSSSMRQALGELGVTFDDELPDMSNYVEKDDATAYDDDSVAQWVENQADVLKIGRYEGLCSLGQSVADAILHRVRTDLVDPDRINDEELLLIARRMTSVLYAAGDSTLVPEPMPTEPLSDAAVLQTVSDGSTVTAEEPWYVAQEVTRRSTDGMHVCYTPEGALWGPYPTIDDAIVASKESNMTTFVFQRSQLLGDDGARKPDQSMLVGLEPELWVAFVDDTPNLGVFNWSVYGPFASQREAREWGYEVQGSVAVHQVKDLLTVNDVATHPVKKA